MFEDATISKVLQYEIAVFQTKISTYFALMQVSTLTNDRRSLSRAPQNLPLGVS
jgi:hypothetical protein